MTDNEVVYTDNDVIYRARLHWILFFWPVALAFFALFMGTQIGQLREVGIILFIFAAIWFAMTWVTYHFSSLTIKKMQIIFRTGMLVRQTVDISIAKIESIDIRQSVLGSILRYGSLVVTGTGGTRHMINFLAQPLTCRRYIEQLMHQ